MHARVRELLPLLSESLEMTAQHMTASSVAWRGIVRVPYISRLGWFKDHLLGQFKVTLFLVCI